LQYFVFPHAVKSLLSKYLIIDISLKDFWLFYAKEIAKTASLIFFVSVRRFSFILNTVRIFSLPKQFYEHFFRKIWLADQGMRKRTIFFDFRCLVVYLYVAIFVCRWRELIYWKFYCLFSSNIIEKKKEKAKNLTSMGWFPLLRFSYARTRT
jgi:hypothetical protein